MTPMGLVPEKVEVITMACCTLHNFLWSHVSASSVYTPPGSLDTEDPETHALQLGEWHCGPQSTVFFTTSKAGKESLLLHSQRYKRPILPVLQLKGGRSRMAVEYGVI